MYMTKTNGFVELSAAEMIAIDGGDWHWYDFVITALLPGYGVGKFVYEDLKNCYDTGYAEGRQLAK